MIMERFEMSKNLLIHCKKIGVSRRILLSFPNFFFLRCYLILNTVFTKIACDQYRFELLLGPLQIIWLHDGSGKRSNLKLIRESTRASLKFLVALRH